MRLVTVRLPSGGTLAAVESSSGRFAIRDGRGRVYEDVGSLLRNPHWRDLAAKAREALPARLPLLRPILQPGAVVCVGANFRSHVLEMGRELPKAPTWFSKNARALTDPETDIVMSPASQAVDYEAELAVVLGSGGRNIPVQKAWEAVAGVTLINDTSMRDFQRRSLQWFAGKSWEGCTPLGPALVTLDEMQDFGDREIVGRVNGTERQRAVMSDLIFDIPTLVADLSQVFTLHPGDVLATGTCGGVGEAMRPPSFLQHGDVVELEMQGLGILRNRFLRPA